MSGASTRAQKEQKEAAALGRAQGLETGWIVSGYMISGLIAYGGIGWLIGRAVHVSLLFPIGMLVGLGISIGYIIYRYGKQEAVTRPSPGGRVSGGRPPVPARKEMTGDQ